MIEKLIKAINDKNAPVVVGLDPKLSFIPDFLKKASFEKYGETLEGAADALFEFNKKIIDETADLIPAVKIQSAMYECFGVPGVLAYKKTIDYSHEKGLIVMGDVKRGDIGSTSEAYADAHIGTVSLAGKEIAPFDEDFCTVNPYLGTDGVKPFCDVAGKCNKGIFVLVKTSNPSSGELQDRHIAKEKGIEGMPISAASVWGGGLSGAAKEELPRLYEIVAELVKAWGKDLMKGDYSEVGAVCGCTYPSIGEALRKKMPNVFILVPGYGAQGGTGADLKVFFNKGDGAIVNSSRGIIAAWQKDIYKEMFDAEHFAEASRRAVEDMILDINKAVGR